MTEHKQIDFLPVIIIPCFNHGILLAKVLAGLATYQLPCIVVDDGSDQLTKQCLVNLLKQYQWLSCIELAENSGKGAAVKKACYVAAELGYSHCLQIDADNQHDLADVPKLLALAKQYPADLISGKPIYDNTMPKSRFYARYITHFWVWIETLSLQIKDSMCGFRVYPLAPTMKLLNNQKLGRRMDFDTEIMVRLYWLGVNIKFVATKITYPTDGISHFNVWQDNLKISWMHTRLCMAMLPKMPMLIKRHFVKDRHWSEQTERKGLWGMKLLLWCYRSFGHKCCSLLLYPIVSYFWLTGIKQRKASKLYLTKLQQYARKNNIELPTHLNSFRHFLRFANAGLDKVAAWLDQIKPVDVEFFDDGVSIQLIKKKQGCFLLVSHLGDIEVCRALSQLSFHAKINALVFTKHAIRFNQIIQEVNPNATINLIQVDKVGIETTILLEQKLQAGEWVAIVGDRTSVASYHRDKEDGIIWSDFLGEQAPFPKGPFILASLFKYPTYFMFCLKPKHKFQIYFEPLIFPELPRNQKQQLLTQLVKQYAMALEKHCLLSPLDWFNFYNFWQYIPPRKLLRNN